MTLDKDQLVTDLQRVIATDPVTLTHGEGDSEQTVDGLKSTYSDAQQILAAGLQKSYLHSYVTCLDDWTAAPAVGDTIVAEEVTYRILRLVRDGAGVELRLDVGAQYEH